VSSLSACAGEGLVAVTKKARGDLIYAALYDGYKTVIPDMVTTADEFEKLCVLQGAASSVKNTLGGEITAEGVIKAALSAPGLFDAAENTNAVYLEATKAEKDVESAGGLPSAPTIADS
jgi:tRNA A37 threonylcarbamoyladenosine modification protein TsaB